MKDINLAIPLKACAFDELPQADRDLISAAREATLRAYAPYSHFSVGAAIALDNGRIVTGSNQENAASPSGTCAERTAAFWAHASFPDARFRTIAIAARGTDGEPTLAPISPCGACRQVLIEYEKLAGEPVRVLLDGAREVYILPSVAALLPLAFTDY